MNKKWIPIIVAIIGLIPILGGGAATNWTFQIGDNTVITDSSQETTITNEGDINIGGDIISEGALILICLQDPIPEEYITACENR